MTLFQLSIAAKLYAIFALLATVTVVVALVAVVNSPPACRRSPTNSESAFHGSVKVERVNALIYAVVMESRGALHAPDIAAAQRNRPRLIAKFNDRIGDVVTEWQWRRRPEDAAQFE